MYYESAALFWVAGTTDQVPIHTTQSLDGYCDGVSRIASILRILPSVHIQTA